MFHFISQNQVYDLMLYTMFLNSRYYLHDSFLRCIVTSSVECSPHWAIDWAGSYVCTNTI